MKPTEVTSTATAEPPKGAKGERFSSEWFERLRALQGKLATKKKPPDLSSNLTEEPPDLPSVGAEVEQPGGQVEEVQVAEVKEEPGLAWKTGVAKVGEFKDSALQSVRTGTEKTFEAASKNKVFKFLKGAAESYLNKFDPRGKDKKAWGAGVIIGGIGSAVAAAEFGATAGFSPVVRSVTLAAILNISDAFYYQLHRRYVSGALDKTYFQSEATRQEVLKRIFELEKDVATKGLKGEEFRQAYASGLTEAFKDQTVYYHDSLNPYQREPVLQTITDKLFKYATDYGVVTGTGRSLRSLSAGLAAGATLGAAETIAIESLGREKMASAVGRTGEWIGERFGGGGAAEVVPPISPVAVVAEEGFLKAPPIPETVITETQEKITSLAESPQFLEQKAATVGKFLDAREQLTRAALEAKGISLFEIDAVSFDKGLEAAQGKMEAQMNEIADGVLRAEVSANPDATLADIAPKIEKAYTEWLSSETDQAQIQEVTQEAVADNIQVESQLVENVTRELEKHPDQFREITIKEGDTLGDLADLTWTNVDAPKLGAHILINLPSLTDGYASIIANYPGLLPNLPFPLSASEITDLVNRMLAGDEEAREILIKAGHYLPIGSRFIILTDEGVNTVLRSAALLKRAA